MAIRDSNQTLLGGLVLTTGAQKDILWPWQDFMQSASGVSGMSASVAAYTLSGSGLAGMRVTATATTCPLWTTVPQPTDMAITGCTPAAGSGQLWIEWTDMATAGAIAVIAASLYAIPYGGLLSAASLLGSACVAVTLTGGASAVNAASIMNTNAPVSPSVMLALKLRRCPSDASDTSGSNFVLFDARLRYYADRIGV